MNEKVRKMDVRIAIVSFLLCGIVSSSLGYYGLHSHSELLSVLSGAVFGTGILIFFVLLVYPFKWDGFWFSYVLQRLGRIGWLRRFGISQHAEGAIDIALLEKAWSTFMWLVVGAGSYLFNDISTIVYHIFAYSWLFFSVHLHYNSLKNLSDLSKIVTDDNQKVNFANKIKRTINFFNKASIGLLILGLILFLIISTFWIDPKDDVGSRLTFYVETPWNGTATFAMAYPEAMVPYYTIKLTTGLIWFGTITVIGGLILVTTILLLWLTSGEIQVMADIYDPDCLKPAEKLLNTFWLLTGAGLLLVPYMTALSINLQGTGRLLAARWTNYISWTYIISFVGMLVFSMAKYSSFVATAKNAVDLQIRRELQEALEPKIDRRKLTATKMKMRLLSTFKSRPTLATILQLVQIISIILLNVLVEFLRK